MQLQVYPNPNGTRSPRDHVAILERAREALRQARVTLERSRATLEKTTAELSEAEESTHTMEDVRRSGL